MKKTLSMVTLFVMLLSYAFVPNMTVYAANISLGVSSSSIQIGDSVNVTVSVPENVTGPIYVTFSNDILEFKSASPDAVSVNGGNINISIGKYGLAGSNKVTLAFKAKTSGEASVSASHGDLYDNNSLEEVKLGSASTKITVENKTTDPGNGGGETTEPQKSGDNSLSSLKLSSGTLSPKFKYNVTKYTATVGYDVTKVIVSAKTSNAKATIESVTGDGNVKLKVGENTIKVVVKAENGVKATYTIVVTRKAQETTVTPEPSESESESESESQSETTTPEVNEVLQWNGEQLQVPAEISAESIPTGFENTSVVVNGQQMQGLSFKKGDLKVLYLNNTNGAGSLYVYDDEQQTIYPFIKLSAEKRYVMVLLPNVQEVPEGFESCTFSIEGKGVINAYQLKEDVSDGTEPLEDSTMSWNLFGVETFYAAEPKLSDFYLIYCMNDAGEKGWYMYDSVEGTFQRYLEHSFSVQTGGEVSDQTDTQAKYAELEKELESAKKTQYIIIGIAAAVVVILIIIIIVLVIKNRSKEDDFFDEYEEDDEYDEEYDEEGDSEDEVEQNFIEKLFADEKDSAENMDTMEENVEDDEDEEIEIEFYEMEEIPVAEKVVDPTSKCTSVTEDDDDDLEFIDFE